MRWAWRVFKDELSYLYPRHFDWIRWEAGPDEISGPAEGWTFTAMAEPPFDYQVWWWYGIWGHDNEVDGFIACIVRVQDDRPMFIIEGRPRFEKAALITRQGVVWAP